MCEKFENRYVRVYKLLGMFPNAESDPQMHADQIENI